jgi:hypothetical protein
MVALAKAQDNLLADFDRLIDSLDHLSRFTDRFSKLGVIAQSLRSLLALLDIESSEGAIFILQLKQHMDEFTADLLTFDPAKDLSPAARETC